MTPTVLSAEQIRAALDDRKLSRVAQACGVPYHQVLALVKGSATVPHTTIQAISDYLQSAQG